jgi:hypothetical protein
MFVDPAETAASQLEICWPLVGGCTETGAIPRTATLDISIDIVACPETDQESATIHDIEIDTTADPQCPLSDRDTKVCENVEELSESTTVPVPADPGLDPDDSSELQEPKVRVIYSFKGQADNELDIEAGEMVVLVEKESHGAFPFACCLFFQALVVVFTVSLTRFFLDTRLVACEKRQGHLGLGAGKLSSGAEVFSTVASEGWAGMMG